MGKNLAVFGIIVTAIYLILAGTVFAQDLSEDDINFVNDYCRNQAEELNGSPGFEKRCRQKETASFKEVYRLAPQASDRVLTHCMNTTKSLNAGPGFFERCLRREMAAEAELNAPEQTQKTEAAMPEYDIAGYCKRTTAPYGSAMEAACQDGEARSKAYIASIEVPWQIMTSCKRMIDETGQGGGYQILDACIQQEMAATEKLGK